MSASLENQLLLRVGGYLYDGLSLNELALWVQDFEEYWATLPRHSEVSKLVGSLMLTWYEVTAGDRDEESAKELVRQAALDPMAAEV
jgi:hypothetical protein